MTWPHQACTPCYKCTVRRAHNSARHSKTERDGLLQDMLTTLPMDISLSLTKTRNSGDEKEKERSGVELCNAVTMDS